MNALVTGGSGYIGGAVVRALSSAGHGGSFTWREREERATALARETGFRPCRADLSRVGAAAELARSLGDEPPRILVHAASAAPGPTTLAGIGEEDFDRMAAVGPRAGLALARHLAPRMKEGGEIVFLAGLPAILPLPAPPHLSATQAAMVGLTRALAKELGPEIRVNLVAVGYTEGGLSASLDPRRAEEYRRFSALGRPGKAEEVARAVLWVALENRYMTGAVVPVTGGL